MTSCLNPVHQFLIWGIHMIPKRIFYVWGAGERKPRDVQVCIQTWRQIMPDYEIIEINENSNQYFDFNEN